MYEEVIALSVLLLPLDPTLRLYEDLGTPESLRLQHCKRILEISELYWEVCPANRHSLLDLYPLHYAASISLIHAPSCRHALDLFGRAISLLLRYVDSFPVALFLLQGLKSVAIRSGSTLSDITMDLLQTIHVSTTELGDVPVAFAMPVSPEILESRPEEGNVGFYQMSVEVGELISICEGPVRAD
jgi:hypothetical protein